MVCFSGGARYKRFELVAPEFHFPDELANQSRTSALSSNWISDQEKPFFLGNHHLQNHPNKSRRENGQPRSGLSVSLSGRFT